MTSSTILPRSSVDPRAGPVGGPPADSAATRGEFDGQAWVHEPGAGTWLRAVPARAWAAPAAQGWQRVKHNARREVWRAVIAGTPFFLKYYFAPRWRALAQWLFRPVSCRAEWDGGRYARQTGIPAVRPAAYTCGLRRDGRRCDLLVTEAVEPACPLNEFWAQLQSDPDGARRRADTAALTDSLAQMIARAHQSGFEHLDMHAANILVQTVAPRRYRTVFVDLHSARRGRPLHDAVVVRNLAQLNQWFRKHSTSGARLRFLRAYLRWRDEYEDSAPHGRRLGLDFAQLVAALAAAARRHAERLGGQRDRRVFRDGRYFSRLTLPGGWRGMAVRACKHAAADSRASGLVLPAEWWRAQLGDPRHWFDGHVDADAVCKHSHSALVRRAVLAPGAEALPVILKRPRARNWRRWLALLLPPSRAARAWRRGHALLHRDIPTARPLAVLERRLGPCVRDSVLVTEALPGALDLEVFLRTHLAPGALSAAQAWQLKRELIARLVRLVRQLQDRGFDHRDCKATNILILPQPSLSLFWIDLDGVRCVRRLGPHRRLRPLVRLEASLRGVPGLTRTDRVRFLKLYFARFGAPVDEWRRAWPDLDAAVARKQKAQAARRAWKRRRYGRD